ncbi:lysoplasmalogenase family protein [Leucobacter sp. USHLN153]|uniref:lysoplasmalogenase family protein n=1 Tax=Leucobacter sp. USHLN153 TaxID=3081268 RepID=UPI0030161431
MTERSGALWPFVPYTVVAVVHVIACFGQYPFEWWTKLLLMPLLALGVVATLVFAPATRVRPVPAGAMGLLLGALLFSWLGDGARWLLPALTSRLSSELPLMLMCFGVAHALYLLLMWRGRGIARRRLPAWSLIYVLAYLVLVALLLPHTKSFSIAVMGYGLLLAATAAMATRCGAIVGWGGALFLLSDAILAFRMFMPGSNVVTSGLVMLSYALGQGLIAYGIVAALRRRAELADSGDSAEVPAAPGSAGRADPAPAPAARVSESAGGSRPAPVSMDRDLESSGPADPSPAEPATPRAESAAASAPRESSTHPPRPRAPEAPRRSSPPS